MSLQKWKELAKRKSQLGNKINFVHNAITERKIGEETSQTGYEKVFKPITSKLDDVILSNLRPQKVRKKKVIGEKPGIDYFPEVDPFEEMDVEGLFDEGAAAEPQPDKQIPASPPEYEEWDEDPPEYTEED